MPRWCGSTDSRRLINGNAWVVGSTGWTCLDRVGNADNKAVTLVRLNPEGRTVDFIDVAWPSGKSHDWDCRPSNPHRD